MCGVWMGRGREKDARCECEEQQRPAAGVLLPLMTNLWALLGIQGSFPSLEQGKGNKRASRSAPGREGRRLRRGRKVKYAAGGKGDDATASQ